jgi:succinyl-diaminopimelate desuccinylase
LSTGTDIAAQVLADIEARREELISLTEELIAAPSLNPPGIVTRAAAVAQRFLEARNHPYDLHVPASGRENIVAHFGGEVPGPHIVMNAHFDVLPIEEGDSGSLPAQPPVRGRKVAGRGAIDMKGGLAAFMFVFDALSRLEQPLPGTLTLCLVCDEETAGPFGSKWLVEHVPDVLGDVLLSTEPSSPGLIRYGEKGLNIGKAIFHGQSGHGAYPQALPNPIVRGAAFVGELEDILTAAFPPAAADPEFDAVIDAALGAGAAHNLKRIVVNWGKIEGGVKHNMAPRQCVVDVDVRTPVGVDARAVMDLVRERVEARGGEYVEVETRSANVSDLDHPLFDALVDSVEEVTGTRPMPSVGLGATDCRMWRDRGIPAGVFGPDPTTMATDSEFIDSEQLVEIAKVHALTCVKLMTTGGAA